MATEQDILDFVSELEAERAPDSLGLASLAPGNDIPAKREKLAVLVSTGKAKEELSAFSSHTTRSNACQIRRWKSYHKRHEAHIGSKITESLIDSLIVFFSKGHESWW